jgi:hypothetical protein
LRAQKPRTMSPSGDRPQDLIHATFGRSLPPNELLNTLAFSIT